MTSWLHAATGRGDTRARQHLGSPAWVTDVAGWAPACICGWQGPAVVASFGTVEQPGPEALAALEQAWRAHVDEAEPALRLVEAAACIRAARLRYNHDESKAAERALTGAADELRAAVSAAVGAGLTWSQVADALDLDEDTARSVFGAQRANQAQDQFRSNEVTDSGTTGH